MPHTDIHIDSSNVSYPTSCRLRAAGTIRFSIDSCNVFLSYFLQAVTRWKADLDGKASLPNGDPIPCLLVANKCDLPDRPIPKEVPGGPP